MTKAYVKMPDSLFVEDTSPVRGANLNQILANQIAIGTRHEFKPPWTDQLVGGAPDDQAESLLRTCSFFVPDRFVGPNGTRLTIQPCYRFLAASQPSLTPLEAGTLEIRYRIAGELVASSIGRSSEGTRGEAAPIGYIDEPVVIERAAQTPDSWIDIQISAIVIAGPATYCNLYMGWHEYSNEKPDIPPADAGYSFPWFDPIIYRTNVLEAI